MDTSTRQADSGARLAAVRELAYATPFGAGRLVLAGDLPLELELPRPGLPAAPAAAGDPWVRDLERYFAGEPVTFAVDVDAFALAHGLTPFERDVYAALAKVPYGEVVSYRELAHAAGRPNAYRATGSVMARNRLPVILPCHRVIRNDGVLGDYGDDPSWKPKLLTLEGVALRRGKVAAA